jgi:tripartite-type tricarboxylate transporter receptor subunit TctC
MTRHLTRRLLLGAAAAPTLPMTLRAQETWPTRPLREVIAFPPGGSSDIIARMVADHLSRRLGQPVVAENRPGGGAMIAAEAVVRAPPDGNTIMFASSTLVISAATMRSPPLDVRRELVPITNLVEAPMLFIGSKQAPFATLREMVDWARANPGKLNFGVPGAGSSNHLGVELFLRRARIEGTVVPYPGNAPAMTALLRGDIHAASDNIATSTPFLADGRIRALAVSSARRAALLPDVPTVAEATPLPDYATSFWFGLMAQAAAPRAAVDRLARECAQIMAQPDVLQYVQQQGYEAVAFGPAQFGERINADLQLWGGIAREAGITT